MSSLLDKLKVKPIPKPDEEIQVKIQQPQALQSIKINQIVKDRRKESVINRSEIMKRMTEIKKPREISTKPPIPRPIPRPIPKPKPKEEGIKIKKPKKFGTVNLVRNYQMTYRR